jgi:4-diphosphocytidyl-2-C-methyl-D-erythritol kinase
VTELPGQRLAPIVRVARAKLNLTLSVASRRPDGYHELHSIMSTIGLADHLSVAIAVGHGDALHVVGPAPGEPDDDLVLRAIRLARSVAARSWAGAPEPPPALAARLEKRIPIAAGLGGGSADGAAALGAAFEAWALDDPALLAELAPALGSDVPFLLAGGLALVEGRGERVTALRPPTGDPLGVLLVTPTVGAPTAAVFDAYAEGARPDDGGSAARAASIHLAEELQRGMSGQALLGRAGIMAVANDLITATGVVVPGIVRLRRELARLLHRPVGQSGSGPTLWSLYPSEADAAEAADIVRGALGGSGLQAPGDAPPVVVATTLETGGPDR